VLRPCSIPGESPNKMGRAAFKKGRLREPINGGPSKMPGTNLCRHNLWRQSPSARSLFWIFFFKQIGWMEQDGNHKLPPEGKRQSFWLRF